MRGVETRIQEIRHKIFTEVARMAYHTEWSVKDRMEALPYKIIPGEKGNFRNDVFLERAIVGERLRLAMGLPYRSAAEQLGDHRYGHRLCQCRTDDAAAGDFGHLRRQYRYDDDCPADGIQNQ